MHIPDGYLSPTTCAVAYAAAIPFWWLALRKIKATMHTRMLPAVALLSAFCFVIMMFNLPLPGGTTGHAVGVSVATVVLGPWASIVAVSVSLFIQALFFGDGGITTFGANCLNIAVLGSLVSFSVYRLAAGRVPSSRRQWIAGGVAGYIAINASALLTAVEFGVQPLWFHDAAGAPLYAPYPLSIAVPAMMIGHLAIAGVAEFCITAGVLRYLQQAHPSLLTLNRIVTGPDALRAEAGDRRLPKTMWFGLSLLVLATPMGLWAAGTAWGEWGVERFGSAAPAGLERLSGWWHAPLADYGPSFLDSANLGYVFSAAAGAALIVGAFFAMPWAYQRLKRILR